MARYHISGGGVYVLVDSPVDPATAAAAAHEAVKAAEKLLCPAPPRDRWLQAGTAASRRCAGGES